MVGLAESIRVWITALNAGYVPSETEAPWEGWAIKQIEATERVPIWVIDLLYARSTGEALGALWQGAREEPSRGSRAAPFEDLVSLELGFLYLRYMEGRLSLVELLDRAGDRTDGSYDDPSCEAFYLLLNEIDGRGPTAVSDVPLEQRVAGLFVPHAQRAKQGLSVLSAGESRNAI